MTLLHRTRCAPAGLALACVALLISAATSRAAAPAAPTNLVGTSKSSTSSVEFTWDDNSDDEAGFNLQVLDDGEWIEPWGDLLPDTTSFTANGPFSTPPGSDWRVRSFNDAMEVSEWSEVVTAFTFNGIVNGGGYHRCEIGDAVSFPITVSLFTDPEISVSNLPDGVTFDPETNTIAGAPTEGGFFAIPILARDGVNLRKGSLALVVIDPPVVTSTPAPVGLIRDTLEIDLNTVFDDPDTETTAVIKTNLGDIPLTLFDTAAPITSDNFKGYMDRGDWDNTIIHRSVPGFVIQGGWLVPEAGSGRDFNTVLAQAQIADEYDDSRPNAESTFSMAKNNPGEATTNWFIGLSDNAQNLDNQAGGFASFARVLGDGMSVVRAIDALEDATYNSTNTDPPPTINGGSAEIKNWPLTAVTEDSPLESQLVLVSRVERVAPLSFQLAGISDPSVVGLSLTDGVLGLRFLTGGEATVSVAATDLDGARTETSFTVTSVGSYGLWSGSTGAGDPGENTDGGVLTDAQEYAFGGAPADALDDVERSPHATEVEVEGETHDAIVFYHRQFTADLNCRVQASSDLIDWDDLWSTSDGIAAALVSDVEDLGGFWKITVRRVEAQSGGGERFFFRLLVELSVDE